MKFTIVRREFNKVDTANGTAIVIGNFDGVHKGHQFLINKAVKLANKNNLIPTLYTFEPHPKKIFMGEKAPNPITPFAEKSRLLKKAGIELLVAKPFTKAFAATHFSEFIKHLKQDLNAKIVIVGEDFAFGKGREGTTEKLKQAGKRLGFETYIVKDIVCDEEARLSSSRVRIALEQGQIKQANTMLGRLFSVRSFLYEDANCNLVANFLRYTTVKNGVYLAKIQYSDKRLKVDTCIVPLKVMNNVGYIPPLAEMPNLIEGKINLSLIEKIEE